MATTRLQAFMDASTITLRQIERESGVPRQGFLLIRKGLREPKVSTVAAIVRSCRRLSGRSVRAADRFDLGEASMHPHHLVGVTESRQSLPPLPPPSVPPPTALLVTHGLRRATVAAAAAGLSIDRVSASVRGDDAIAATAIRQSGRTTAIRGSGRKKGRRHRLADGTP
jgi:hypothetical protein